VVDGNNSVFVGILQSNVVLLSTALISKVVKQFIKNKNSNLKAGVVFVQIAIKLTATHWFLDKFRVKTGVVS